MRAMAFAQHGGVDVLQMMDLPKPEIDDDEVLVQVSLRAQSSRRMGTLRAANQDSDAAHRRLRDDRCRRRSRQADSKPDGRTARHDLARAVLT